MNGVGQTASAVASGTMNAVGSAAPAITGGIIGFGLGGPPGAIAGFALGVGLAERVFPRLENRAARTADSAEQELMDGIKKTFDAAVGVISHYGNLWGPIYLGYMGSGGFEDVAHRTYDWYEQHCELGNETFGNQVHCNANLILGVTAYVMAGAAVVKTAMLLNNVLTGKASSFQGGK